MSKERRLQNSGLEHRCWPLQGAASLRLFDEGVEEDLCTQILLQPLLGGEFALPSGWHRLDGTVDDIEHRVRGLGRLRFEPYATAAANLERRTGHSRCKFKLWYVWQPCTRNGCVHTDPPLWELFFHLECAPGSRGCPCGHVKGTSLSPSFSEGHPSLF